VQRQISGSETVSLFDRTELIEECTLFALRYPVALQPFDHAIAFPGRNNPSERLTYDQVARLNVCEGFPCVEIEIGSPIHLEPECNIT
jgi:hypothetical protein